MTSIDGVRDLIRFINTRHATAFRVVGRFPRGEQGAFEMIDAVGARFVLK